MMRESLVGMLANKLTNGQLRRFARDDQYEGCHHRCTETWRGYINMGLDVRAFGLEELQSMIEADTSYDSLRMLLDSFFTLPGVVGQENAARINVSCKKFYNL